MDASAATGRQAISGDAWKVHAPTESSRDVARDGGRYELIGELASGGMATVYLARMRGSMGLSRLVAVKAMHPHYAKDSAFTSMFVDEARLTARLRHPNVVPTLDIVAGGGELLLIMEYIEGEALSVLLKTLKEKGERVPVGIACAIVHDTLLGLHAAHEAKDDDGQPLAIIHRDVSPQNVIVGVDGLARVLDFGVAKARCTVHSSYDGEIKGKVPYMPPEQLFGEALDRKVDVYAAGIILWETLVGARLFDGPSEEIIVKRISDGDVPLPSTRATGISPELDAIVKKALSPKAEDRFATAHEMAEQLAGVLTLPTRTEIAAWVRRYVREGVQPISGRTSKRELAFETTTDAGAIVAGVRASYAPDAPKQRPRWVVVASAAVALACAALGLVSTQHLHGERVANAATAAAPVVTIAKTAEAPRVEVPAATEIAPTPAPAKPKTSAAPKAPTDGARAAHVTAPAPTAPPAIAPAPAPAADDAKKPDCKLPYVVDAEGHRHYKVECL